MSKYRITLDGKTYEMEVELITENGVKQPAVRKENRELKSSPKEAAVKAVEPSTQKQTVMNAGDVVAPMPGTVIRIVKGEGETVKSGELVLVLEAMKMENEIAAPVDGTITKMRCTVGGTVAGGEVMFEVK